MNCKLNEKQIEIINNWLEEAYNQGYRAGLSEVAQGNTNDSATPSNEEKIYPVHNCIVDLSSFQPTPNYDELCNKTDFIILRARYCNKTDSTFEERAKELNARNMPFAVYDYVTLMSDSNAKTQAETFYNLCEKYHPSVYYIDTEQLGTGVSRGSERGYIKTYVGKLRELGAKRIGHYTGDWLYSTYYWQIQDLFDTVWIASYGKNTGIDEHIELKSAAKTNKVDLHQYTDKGIIPGISTKGDLSHLTGTVPLNFFTGRKYL